MILRQLLSIAILPVTVTVVIPIWLARRHGMRFAIGTTTPEILLQLVGAASLAVGLLLFASSLRQFAVRGKGHARALGSAEAPGRRRALIGMCGTR